MSFADQLTAYIRVARGLEAGGYYGVAKLLRGLAFAEEVKAANAAGIPRETALLDELRAIIEQLRSDGADAVIITALEQGCEVVKADATVPYDVIPAVHVSRTSGEIFLGEPPAFSANHDHRLGLRSFPAIWYFESLSPPECLKALESNVGAIEAQFSDLPPEQYLIPPAAGEWNMHELLWHLLQANELLAGRVEKMLTESNPSLEGMAVWANRDASSLSLPDIWERYRASREVLLARLKAIPLADWWRTGWHSEFGPQTVLSQATYFARHEMSHMPQFGEIRRGLGK